MKSKIKIRWYIFVKSIQQKLLEQHEFDTNNKSMSLDALCVLHTAAPDGSFGLGQGSVICIRIYRALCSTW